jgi:hypothetical protein
MDSYTLTIAVCGAIGFAVAMALHIFVWPKWFFKYSSRIVTIACVSIGLFIGLLLAKYFGFAIPG